MGEFPLIVTATLKEVKEIGLFFYLKLSSIKGLICVLIILNFFIVIFHLFRGWTFYQISFPVLNVLLIAFWYLLFYIPRNPKNKIGFYIAINTESSTNGDTFKLDFIKSLQKSLDLGNTGRSIYFKILPSYISTKIDSIEMARKIIHKYKATFLLYGSVRTRIINKVETSVIDLNGAVTHKPISETTHSAFTREFTELLPSRILIDNENDVLKYEITAQWMDIIAKYIIGISFYISGSRDRALLLYDEVFALLNTQQINIPSIIKIRERMPTRFYEVYSQSAIIEFNEWLEKEGNHPLTEYKQCVSKMFEHCKKIGSIHLFRAILLFLESRKISEAQLELNLCKGVDKAILFCNYAFLYGYRGVLSSARTNYKKAAKLQVPINAINEIEDFILAILKIEPEKYTLYYCLAWINLCIKNDIKQAKNDFNLFFKKNPDGMYVDEIRITKNYIEQLP